MIRQLKNVSILPDQLAEAVGIAETDLSSLGDDFYAFIVARQLVDSGAARGFRIKSLGGNQMTYAVDFGGSVRAVKMLMAGESRIAEIEPPAEELQLDGWVLYDIGALINKGITKVWITDKE